MEKSERKASPTGASTGGTFSECDTLLSEINNLIADINRGPLSPSLAKLNPMHTWNDRRKSTNLLGRASSLLEKITEKEAGIRKIIGESAENKEKRRCEGAVLKKEVYDGIAYMENLSVNMEVLAENMRFVIDAVTREAEEVKDMVTFNKEVIRQIQLEKAANGAGGFHGRWGAAARGRMSRQLALQKEQEAVETDEQHIIHLEKLVSLRMWRDRLVSSLTPVLELKESYLSTQSLLDHALESLDEHCTGGKISAFGNSGDSIVKTAKQRYQAQELNQTELLTLFNGLNRAAVMCVEALIATKDDIGEAHSRLQSLVESRELLGNLQMGMWTESASVSASGTASPHSENHA